jgi:hypothetical protein
MEACLNIVPSCKRVLLVRWHNACIIKIRVCVLLVIERFFEDQACIDMPVFLSSVRSDQVLCHNSEE